MDENPPIGTLLGKQYRLTEIIGEGGMGLVYRARQETVGRDVAVKILRARHSKDEAVVRRFENEARIISQLRHPNTLRLYDTQRMETGGIFIVTEFLQGQSLEQLLRQGPLAIERVIHIADQICASLSEAHSVGVVHRDLKPGNIFLDRVGGEDFVKVLDFGIAKLAAGSVVKTQANVIMGTPAYMSPEQVKGEIADARSDVYAVGVLIYQMLVGRQPFTADNPVTLLMKQVNDPPPPFPQGLGVPPELETLVFEMLSKHPDFRPQRVTDVRERLRAIGRTIGSHFPSPASATPATGAPRPPISPTPMPSFVVPPKKTPVMPTMPLPLPRVTDEAPTMPNLQQPLAPPEPKIDGNVMSVDLPIEPVAASMEMFLDEAPIDHLERRASEATKSERSTWLLVVGAVAVAAVLIGVGFMMFMGPEEAPFVESPSYAPDSVPMPVQKAAEQPVEQKIAEQKVEPAKVDPPAEAKLEQPVVKEEPAPPKEEPAPAIAEDPAKEKKSKRKKRGSSSSSDENDDALERAAEKLLAEPAPEVEAEKKPEPKAEPEVEAEPEQPAETELDFGTTTSTK